MLSHCWVCYTVIIKNNYLKHKFLACTAFVGCEESEKPESPPEATTEEAGVVGKVASAPVTLIQKLLGALGKLLKKLLDAVNGLLSKPLEDIEKLVGGLGGKVNGVLEKVKCILKDPLNLANCL